MKVGFIGTGSMGSLLIEAFIQSGALLPEQIRVSNRSPEKAQKLAKRHPGLTVCSSNTETASQSDLFFLCVKPLEFKTVISEIKDQLEARQIAISITSPVQLIHLESTLPCKVAKIIPSITNITGGGASLCMYGSRIKEEDRQLIESLLSYISRPLEILESHTRITSDFSSCGPAFLSLFMEKWIDAAVEMTGIDRKTLNALAGEMLLGTGKLLTEEGFSPEQLQERVAVPGGITAQALTLLESNLNGLFYQLIQTTHDKYEEDLAKLDAAFGFTINRPRY
ncbi:late competence protein ComER [Paenibacillus glucanolyticus]|jgi:competence protein ComER|uniref:late competence protein ComER n=1 Tax=Paenibacillus TaxID=44249 RepID=UPI0003E2553C|nr:MULTISPECIES: late competence protein ComER [Paenibacillus]ANA81592.1 late competence protein ComER [Paenibacillus glucanolyticus]AVV59677.1 late competence protein ComER [Paenibacillus glucanolyticus]ETT30374.1 late competence protein ComER [Paenibacillus sp. FSL R5-808]MDH6672973.1 competence protein ComER [Paenibacillus sp. LBL]MPY19554.1 late competence protein ComER [Paenibacillus glucanolyticus]